MIAFARMGTCSCSVRRSPKWWLLVAPICGDWNGIRWLNVVWTTSWWPNMTECFETWCPISALLQNRYLKNLALTVWTQYLTTPIILVVYDLRGSKGDRGSAEFTSIVPSSTHAMRRFWSSAARMWVSVVIRREITAIMRDLTLVCPNWIAWRKPIQFWLKMVLVPLVLFQIRIEHTHTHKTQYFHWD
jgi:hypothetical protein